MASTFVVLLIITLLVNRAFSSSRQAEPACSKFDYDERLLEKLVRMENAMNQHMDNWKSAFEAQSVLIKNLQKELNDVKENKRESFAPSHVVFSARGVTKNDIVEGEALVFTTPLINLGSGYNEATGYFLAPVGGTYLFVVQICTSDNHHAHIYLKAADKIIVSSTHEGMNGRSGVCVSYTGISVLRQGDMAWVEGSHPSLQGITGDRWRWNVFSGVLLYETKD